MPPPDDDPRRVHGKDAALSRTSHRLISALVKHSKRGDPGWAADWRKAVRDHQPRFDEWCLQKGHKSAEENANPWVQGNWYRLLNIETTSFNNASRYVLDPKHTDDEALPSGFVGFNFYQIEEISRILVKFFYLATIDLTPRFEDRRTWGRVFEHALSTLEQIWQDEDKAATNLSNNSEGIDRFASETPAARPVVWPPEMPTPVRGFLGRDRELGHLHARLRDESGRRWLAVHAIGGMGKTSLVAEYARIHARDYGGLWWSRAETRASLVASLANLRGRLPVAPTGALDLEEEARAALEVVAAQQPPWLLIYDNAASSEVTRGLLPTEHVPLLITSRFPYWSEWCEDHELGPLSAEHAVELLQARSGKTDPSGAAALVRKLDCLALAVDHAGAYCREYGATFAEYERQLDSLIKIAPSGTHYATSIYATVEIAIGPVADEFPLVEDVLAFISFCAPDRFPKSLFAKAFGGEEAFDQVVAALRRVSLLKAEVFSDGVSAVVVHRMVQAAGRARARDKGILRRAIDRLVDALDVYPSDPWNEPESWQACEELNPHVLAVWKSGHAPTDKRWVAILEYASGYFYVRGDYAEAEALCRDALKLAENIWGTKDYEVALLLNQLAFIKEKMGAFADTKVLLERALEIKLATAGPRRATTAATMSSLAEIERVTGNLVRARDLAQEAVAIYERDPESEQLRYSGALVCLSNAVFDMGDLRSANELDRKVLAIRERALPKGHHDIRQALNNLATSLMTLGATDEAEVILRRALADAKKELGPSHVDTLQFQSNLADLIGPKGARTECLALAREAVSLAQDNPELGLAHPKTAEFQATFAFAMLADRQFQFALMHGRAALEVLQRTAGDEANTTRRAAAVTAHALVALGNAAEAEGLRAKYENSNWPWELREQT